MNDDRMRHLCMRLKAWKTYLSVVGGFCATQAVLYAQADPDTLRALATGGGPTITFEGQVDKLQGTTIAGMQPSPTSAVIKVLTIIDAPPYFSGYRGREVTVEFKQQNELPIGAVATFYTTGEIIGPEIAVKELSHSQDGIEHAKALLNQLNNDAAMGALRLKVDATPVIISGQVIDITHIASGAKNSEHQVETLLATVKISTVEKNKTQAPIRKSQTIAIIFPDPQERDITSVTAPRFTVGQTGVWFLHKISGSDRLRLGVSSTPATTYNAPDSSDFTSTDQLATIRAVLK
jgi:hypothetical protein